MIKSGNPMSEHQHGIKYPSIIQKVADFWNLFNQATSDIILNEMHFDPERSSSDEGFRNKGGFSNFDVGIQRAVFDTYIRYVNQSHDKPQYNFPTENYRDSYTLKNIMKFRNLIGNEVGRIKTNRELNDTGFFKEVELNSCVCCNKVMEGNNFCNFCESGEHSEKSSCAVHDKNIRKEKQREGSIKIKSDFPGLKKKIFDNSLERSN